jgi:hypothetical protein
MGTPVNYGEMVEIQMEPIEVEEIMQRIKEMPEDGLMVEWGSGGSTVRWLETMSEKQRLITIEHDERWFNKVGDYIGSRPELLEKFEAYYHAADKNLVDHRISTPYEEHPMGLDNYFLPDKRILDADFFFIDGLSRAAIAFIVRYASTKPNPIIYIHDHWQGRDVWYSWATQFYPKMEQGAISLMRLYK